MKRPNKKNYLTTNQIEYNQMLNKYYDDLEAYIDILEKQLTLTDVVKSLPTKEEINLAANEFSDINGIICEDEYWVIAKNDGFQEGADFVINKLK